MAVVGNAKLLENNSSQKTSGFYLTIIGRHCIMLFVAILDCKPCLLYTSTKLDGTARGGIVIAIKDELGLPVKYIGVGEQIDDLQPFSPQDFADALFDE